MLSRPNRTRAAALAALTTLTLGLTACGDTADEPTTVPTVTPTVGSVAPVPTTEPTAGTSGPPVTTPTPDASGSATAAPAGQVFGSRCPQLPSTGPGSLADVAGQPAAEAASEIPGLSSAAVSLQTARLTDALDDLPEGTVFVPDDTAFRDLGVSRLRQLLTDRGRAADVLRYHVVPDRLSPEQLAGSHRTLSGQTLEVTGSGEDFRVGGQASVVCGNIQTANATLYVIDQVLTLPS